MKDVYQIITDRVISLLEAGTVSWQRPWGGPEDQPRNLVSDKPYRGINTFLLSTAGYESPYWLTFKQANQRGGHIRKGEHGYPCIYWNWIERDKEGSEDKQKIPFLKSYTVFNVNQCEKIEYPQVQTQPREFSPIQACENVVTNMPNAPTIHYSGNRACYAIYSDQVQMPHPQQFNKSESYYNVLFHELVHSTGHETRLNRKGITQATPFGTHTYSKEELVAEMGATFLCGHTGIENQVIDNSASYIASWLGRLRNDNKLVIQAAAQSQKAVDYILQQPHKNEERS